jgi:hypothetical protein
MVAFMRFPSVYSSIAAAGLAVVLSACATSTPAPIATAAPPTAAAAVPATPLPAANILTSAGRANAATMDQIARALGAADITRQDGAGTALTYRLDHCALLLLFTADQRNVMRLAEADPSPRRSGDPIPSLDQCVAEAHARPQPQRR